MQKQRASKLHHVRSKKYWEMILGGVGGKARLNYTSPGNQTKKPEFNSITDGGQLKNFKPMSDITNILREISNS